MATGDIDAGDFTLYVGGVPISQFTGLTDWRVDKSVTYNEGPGGRAFGFNHQRHSNKVSFTISVRETSPDLEYLQQLVEDETRVAITAEVSDDSDLALYGDGQEIGLGCEQGILTGGNRGKGQGEAEDVTFDVLGIGPTKVYKNTA